MNENHKNKIRLKQKDRVISARFSELEYRAIKKRAKDAGVTLSKFTRSVLLTGKIVQRISKEDASVIRSLSGEANNLNQLARSANTSGFAHVANDLIQLRTKIINIINRLSDDWKNHERSHI